MDRERERDRQGDRFIRVHSRCVIDSRSLFGFYIFRQIILITEIWLILICTYLFITGIKKVVIIHSGFVLEWLQDSTEGETSSSVKSALGTLAIRGNPPKASSVKVGESLSFTHTIYCNQNASVLYVYVLHIPNAPNDSWFFHTWAWRLKQRHVWHALCIGRSQIDNCKGSVIQFVSRLANK